MPRIVMKFGGTSMAGVERIRHVADRVRREAEDGDEVFGAPKGEFWYLPVHKDDRRCVDVKDREIRTWVNEGESSSDEDDDSGEESEESESGAVDEYDNDDSELTSGASSQESSEEDNGGEDSDGEL